MFKQTNIPIIIFSFLLISNCNVNSSKTEDSSMDFNLELINAKVYSSKY